MAALERVGGVDVDSVGEGRVDVGPRHVLAAVPRPQHHADPEPTAAGRARMAFGH